MINKNAIPDGWEIKKLGEVLNFIGGGTPDKSNKIFWNGSIPWASVKDIKGTYLTQTQDKITETGLANSSAQLAQPGEVILITRIYPGKTVIAKIETAINQDLKIIKPKAEIEIPFIHYLFQTIEKEIIKNSSGTTVLGIRLEKLKEIEISLPPLSEQQEIVAKIEELLSELDQGKQQLETARQQLKVYRQAVLNSAIKGEANKPLESVIENLDQGWSPKCHNEPSTDNDEWAVIKTTAIQAGYFLDNENKRLPKELKPRQQHELKKGDLLITRAGPRVRVGVCCMVKQTRPKLLNCDKVYRMRISSEVAIPEYIELLLNSPKYSKEIERMKTGISDSGVNLTQKGFIKILIPVPTLVEQNQIVQEIESRLSVCDKVEETITQSLQQAETLRQSILKKAFEGKLTF